MAWTSPCSDPADRPPDQSKMDVVGLCIRQTHHCQPGSEVGVQLVHSEENPAECHTHLPTQGAILSAVPIPPMTKYHKLGSLKPQKSVQSQLERLRVWNQAVGRAVLPRTLYGGGPPWPLSCWWFSGNLWASWACSFIIPVSAFLVMWHLRGCLCLHIIVFL